jgi:menaquinone-dependent protoporphyrinogen IX oxidase
MRALVVYESMYGNTRAIAIGIAAGLGARHEVTVVPVTRATRELVAAADLVVAGGPTHMHGMSTAASRRAAAEAAAKEGSGLAMDPDADSAGMRGWLSGIGERRGIAVAFDTRLHGAPLLTGRASRGISALLERHGYRLLAAPESFLVTKQGALLQGEAERASAWGASIGEEAAFSCLATA